MQPELFQELSTSQRPRRFKPPLFLGRFLRVRIAYEDLIFSSLALLLVILAGFCLGVERGKQIVHLSAPSGLAEERPISAQILPVLPSASVSQAQGPVPAEKAGEFVIQLASYLDREGAQKEAQRLRRQGFSAQVVKQGRYFELRAAGYRSRAEALVSLADLKKTYRDGFVKRL